MGTDKSDVHHRYNAGAFQNIDFILIRETSLNALVDSVAKALIKSRNYKDAAIVLLDNEKIQPVSGDSCILDKSLYCLKESLENEAPLLFKHTSKTCKNCGLKICDKTWASFVIQLKYGDKIYGILFVTLKKELVSIKTEQNFLKETALNIAAGIHRIIQENIFKKTATDLKKRNRELNFFYSFSKLIENKNSTLEKILQGGVELITKSMQHPEKAGAELFLGDTEEIFKTPYYKETSLRIKNKIIVNKEPIGVLTVSYLESADDNKSPVFLEEEKKLINSASVRMSKIIERKRDRLSLEESEKRFRDLTKNAVTGTAILQAGHIVFNNPEYEKIFGSLTDSPFLSSNRKIHPDDMDKIEAFRKTINTSDFNCHDVDFRISSTEKQGNRHAEKSVFCRATRTEFNSQDAVVLNIMDMTKPKELEHLLRIQDKMTSLGRVAAGIAHEIRNPLSGINIYLKALEKICKNREESETEEEILFKIQSASNRIEAVIKKVLDFSKPASLHLTDSNINIPVQSALDFASVTLRKSGVTIETELAQNSPPCTMDCNMIEQVLINLLINASEAMKTNRKKSKIIFISTYCSEDEYICIDVEDSGVGIPESLHDKIFDPFYTTKNSSGIGLSICKRIIKDHKGLLDVNNSTKLKGAKFTISLPV